MLQAIESGSHVAWLQKRMLMSDGKPEADKVRTALQVFRERPRCNKLIESNPCHHLIGSFVIEQL